MQVLQTNIRHLKRIAVGNPTGTVERIHITLGYGVIYYLYVYKLLRNR